MSPCYELFCKTSQVEVTHKAWLKFLYCVTLLAKHRGGGTCFFNYSVILSFLVLVSHLAVQQKQTRDNVRGHTSVYCNFTIFAQGCNIERVGKKSLRN